MSKGQFAGSIRWVAAASAVAAVAWVGCTQWEGISIQESNLVSPNGAITQGADEARTNWYPDQPGLDPAIVGGPNFKRLFKTALPLSAGEKVLAQPLVVGGKVLIVTEANNLYLLDAVTGAITNQRALGTGYDAQTIGCGDITPTVGITGTPVVDTSSNTAYFFSKASSGAYTFHAIDAGNLAEKAGFPVTISGAAQNDASVTFDSIHEHQRPGMLLMGGVVYGAFAAHCDIGNYRGWIIGVSTAGVVKTRFSTEVNTTGHGAGIWMSGAGLASDGAGQILFATGNGYTGNLYPNPIASNAPPNWLEEAAVRAVVQGDGSLKATDWFAPQEARMMGDNDLAGGGISLLPSQFGTATFPRTAAIVGKGGIFYLLNRDKLGGFQQGANMSDDVLTEINLSGGTWGHPAVWPGDGGWIFVTSNGGTGGLGFRVQVLKFGTNGTKPTVSLVGTATTAGATDNFGSYSGSPVVTSNNTSAGSAVVWVVGNTAQLRAYKLQSPNLVRIFADSTGSTAKFQTVGVGAGRVYVGSGDGNVLGYGAGTASITAAPLDFGTVTVGQQKTLTATITANQSLTIPAGGLTSSNGVYTLGTPNPALPATLAANASLTLPVTFKPTAPGSVSGAVNVAIQGGGGGTVSLTGVGQVNAGQLNVTPSMLAFGGITTGTTKALTLQLQNTGNQTLTFSGFTAPAAPYSVTGVPASGATLAAGASTTATVTFAPTAGGSFTSNLVINSNGGNATIQLTGSAGSAPVMVITPLSTDFGTIAAGASKTLSFTVKNTGGTDLQIVKSKPPALGQFVATTTLAEGSVVTAGQTLTESVKLSSSTGGTFNDIWVITGSDAPTTPINVAFTGTVTGSVTALPRTGWVASANPSVAGDTPAMAIDASTTTRYTSGAPMADGMYFQVDMTTANSVSQVSMVSTNGDYARGYQVFVTNDTANLGAAVATGTAVASPVTVSFAAKSGRYVRVVLFQVGTQTAWWSIQDFNVYGTGGGGTGTGGSGGSTGAGGSGGSTGAGGSGSATRINSGGPAVSPYVADVNFTGGATINHANTIDVSGVTNPAPAAVYQTARVGNFSYTLSGFAANSSHTVRLHMCETFFNTAGSRVFNVTLNGTQVLTNFDIRATAGAQNKANVQQFSANANASGQYVIQFTTVVNQSLVSGIEIL
jgi:Malectin domain/Abnormal spindle-like microcephaly-assoc'd, ASPM-SPD-2-Hydin/F5/8 type C domain